MVSIKKVYDAADLWRSACFFECDVKDVDIDMLNMYNDIKPFIKEAIYE